MTSSLNFTRGSSASEQTSPIDHVTNGRVMVPSRDTPIESKAVVVSDVSSANTPELANGTASATVPASNGTVHSAGSGHATVKNSVTNVNGGSSGVNGVNGGSSGVNGVNGRPVSTLSGSASWFRPDHVPAPISFLNHGSSADNISGGFVNPPAVSLSTPMPKCATGATQQPIGTRGVNYNPARSNISFTTDVGPNTKSPGGHYLKLDNVVGKQVNHLMMTMNRVFDWQSKVTGCFSPAPIDTARKTALYVRFDDVHDAAAASGQVETVDTTYRLTYISQSEWAAAQRDSQHGTQTVTSFFDGQVLFTCEFLEEALDFHEQKAGLEGRLKVLAEEFGTVLVFAYHHGEGGKMVYRVEYSKISSAMDLLNHVTEKSPKSIGGWTVTAREMVPLEPELKTVTPPINEDGLNSQYDVARDVVTQYISPTGRTAWGVDIHGNTVQLPAPRPVARVKGPLVGTPLNAAHDRTESDPTGLVPVNRNGLFTPQDARSMTWPLVPHFTQLPSQSFVTPKSSKKPQHLTPDGPNKIYPHKIVEGTDVRTSVMIRNLPNELSFEELKRILDWTSHGRYDFSYLRIDFNNGKNVGYGFVNFVTAEDIIPFHDEYFGKPWVAQNKLIKKGPPRLADLSYATIQGLDCLIDKMRNSSVMDENPDSRPKLWWTVETAVRNEDIGEERPFPGVNNMSKKQRSRENAAQIGLYTHGSRQARAQRGHGHQSHFDRGTPSHLQEEAFWNQMTPYHNSYGYSNQPAYGYHGQTPRGFSGHHAVNMAVPPQFQHFQQMPQTVGYNNHFHSAGGYNAPGGQVQFTDPFPNHAGQQFNGLAPSSGSAYDHQTTQYGPMNEMISTPVGGQRFVYTGGQEPQEMPAIPEESEEYVHAGVEGHQATIYNQNGSSYARQ